jgi:thioredoxin 2
MTQAQASSGTPGRPISILRCPSCEASNRIAPSPRGAPHCGTCGKPLPWLVNATDATFDLEAQASPTVVVDLWAPWCGPCRFVGPILEELSREWAGRLKVIKVNVDDNQRLAIRYDARSIPTMLVMRDGQVVDRIVGALPRPALETRIAPHLKPPRTEPQPGA